MRLEVRTAEYTEPWIEMRMQGSAKLTGSIEYSLTSRQRSCGLSTTRPEAGRMLLTGTPYASSEPGARRYRLFLTAGRRATTPQFHSSRCTYFAGDLG